MEGMLAQDQVRGAPQLLMTVNEAAKALGISEAKVWQLIGEQSIPSLKIGKSRRIPLDELKNWVAARTERAA